jgi:alpha-N-arabinofuranosidase
VDEWNVWYKARAGDHASRPGWPRAPALIEEAYNFEDALACGGALCVLMNNADRVKVACLAQLVNAIGAIRAEPGIAWRQTIFHPFALAARYALGTVLQPAIASPSRPSHMHPEAPYLVASATFDETTGRLAIFALNRHPFEAQDFTAEWRGMPGPLTLVHAIELHHTDMTACNTAQAPHEVSPAPHPHAASGPAGLSARLAPASWNVFVLQP